MTGHHDHRETTGTWMIITMLLNFGITLVEIVGGWPMSMVERAP